MWRHVCITLVISCSLQSESNFLSSAGSSSTGPTSTKDSKPLLKVKAGVDPLSYTQPVESLMSTRTRRP